MPSRQMGQHLPEAGEVAFASLDETFPEAFARRAKARLKVMVRATVVQSVKESTEDGNMAADSGRKMGKLWISYGFCG